jgi:hypothetical protein
VAEERQKLVLAARGLAQHLLAALAVGDVDAREDDANSQLAHALDPGHEPPSIIVSRPIRDLDLLIRPFILQHGAQALL